MNSHILFSAALLTLFAAATGSRSEAAAPSRGLLLVANKAEHTMGIIDTVAGQQLATIPENGITGHELVASPDGRTAYVPIYGNSGVGLPGTDGSNMVVIDLASRKIINSLDFGRGVRPHCAVWGPKDGMLYVTTELDKAVTIIDPRTLKIVGSVPTGQPESHMLAISRDGRRGYTANVGPGTVSVLDMQAHKTLDIIHVAPQIQRISLSADDRFAFTSDQTKPQLAVIDTASHKVKSWVPLPGTGYGTAATPDGKWLVVAVPHANQVAVVELASMRVAHTIDVPAAPQEILVQPDGKFAYASCDASHKVAMIRTSDWKVEKLIDAGAGVDGLAWAAGK